MELSLFKLIVILAIVVIIFGAGKLPGVMGDIGKSIRSLKDGLKGGEDAKVVDPKRLPESNKDENA